MQTLAQLAQNANIDDTGPVYVELTPLECIAAGLEGKTSVRLPVVRGEHIESVRVILVGGA